MARKKRQTEEENSPKQNIDYATRLKHMGGVVSSLERTLAEARLTEVEDVEMIVKSALNLCFSHYYLCLRGEYLESENTWELEDTNLPASLQDSKADV